MKLLDVDKPSGTILNDQDKEQFLLKGLSNALLELLNGDNTALALQNALSLILKVIDAEGIYLIEFNWNKKGKMGINFTSILDEHLKNNPQFRPANYVEVDLNDVVHKKNMERLKSREIVLIESKDFLSYGKKINQFFFGLQMESLSAFPILVGETLWGCLTVIRRTKKPPWTTSEKQMLILFSQTLSTFLARHRVEKALKESEQRLDMIIEGAKLGSWVWEIPSNHIDFNAQWAQMLGYELEELKPSLETFIGLIHPEDAESLWAHINQHLRGETELFEVEFRMKTKSGKWRWILDRGRIVEWDSNGFPVRAYGTHMDITEKKVNEIKLKESEALFRSMYENSPLGIAYTNAKGLVIRANQKYCELLGYAPEEIVGKDFRGFTHPEDSARQEEMTAKNYKENITSFQLEKRYIRKNGDTVWANVATAYLHDEAGKFQSVITIVEDITEKKIKLDELVEREALLRSLFENSSLGIIIKSSERKVVRVNKRQCEMLGYTEREFLELNRLEYVAPASVVLGQRLIAKALQKQESRISSEAQYIKKDGTYLWVNLSLSIIYDEEGNLVNIVTMAEDISERYTALQALKGSEALQKATLNALPDLKLRLKQNGEILEYYPSREEEEMALLPPASCVGQKLSDVYPEFIAKGILHNVLQTIKTKEVRNFEYVMPFFNQLVYFEARISAINEEEVIAMIRNISQRKKMQQSLQEKVRELDINNKELQKYIDSNLELENFAYIASHDLREPVRTMRTFAQLLKKRYGHKLEESGKNYIDFIVDGSNNMNHLIEDLLTYSRVNTDKHFVEEVHLQELIQEILDSLGDVIQKSGVKIQTSSLPAVILANPTKVKQLFQNLISNAIKFRKLEITPVVKIYAQDVGMYWQFSVEDNGIGIDPEFHDRIFMLFKKLHNKREYQGTGLGLAICKKIVEQHYGNIWVESLPDQGASFKFTLKKEPTEV